MCDHYVSVYSQVRLALKIDVPRESSTGSITQKAEATRIPGRTCVQPDRRV